MDLTKEVMDEVLLAIMSGCRNEDRVRRDLESGECRSTLFGSWPPWGFPERETFKDLRKVEYKDGKTLYRLGNEFLSSEVLGLMTRYFPHVRQQAA